MNHLEGLNPPQLRAVETISGPLLVLAGAGTGKTRVVTCRIVEILTKGIPPGAICAVTFTNKAAREMKERVKKVAGKRKVTDMVVSTFHSLGLRVLREFGSHIGLTDGANIADDSDQTTLITDALRECGLSRTIIRPNDAKWKISLWKNAGRMPDEALELADPGVDSSVAMAYGRYEAELRRQKLLDFDDLILQPLRLFREAPEVLRTLQDRWRYLLVDEYQDTNGCQYDMIQLLAGERRNVCAVGDDDQSIYAWRGADPERILRYTQDFAGAEVITLDQNYRSTGRILDAANTLIAGNSMRREKTLWSALGRGEPIDLYLGEDEKDELDFVVSRITMMRQKDGLKWEDCAILFRANSQCRPLEQALRQRQMPYRVVGTRSFFDRREVRDLLSFLRVARNPADDSALLRIVNTPPRGIGKGSIDKVLGWAADARSSALPTMRERLGDLPKRAREGAESLLAIIDGIIERSERDGIWKAMAWFIEEIQYKDHLRTIIDDALELDARLTIVDELIDGARVQQEAGERSLESYLDALALRDKDSEKEEDTQGITLLTMHAAKGLEYPVVFIIGMEEGILPHKNSVDAEDDYGDTGIEEERRLAYVGITRARERLTLSYAKKRTRFGRTEDRTMSRFLDEIGLDTFCVTDAEDDTPADPEMAEEIMRQIRSRFSGGAPPDADAAAASGSATSPAPAGPVVPEEPESPKPERSAGAWWKDMEL